MQLCAWSVLPPKQHTDKSRAVELVQLLQQSSFIITTPESLRKDLLTLFLTAKQMKMQTHARRCLVMFCASQKVIRHAYN